MNKTIFNPLKSKYDVDFYLSTNVSSENENLIKLYEPVDYSFSELNLKENTWVAQFKHFKKLIKMIRESSNTYLFIM